MRGQSIFRVFLACTFAACGTATALARAIPPTACFGVEGSQIPLTKTWNGGTWSTSSSMLSINQKPRWAIAKSCPNRDEIIAVFSDDRDDINAMVFDGTSWGNLIEPSTDLGTHSDRPFYLAYEQLSGKALLCFRRKDDNKLYFRTWNGSAWSNQNSTAAISANKLKWVKMAAKPNSNEILVGVLGENRDLIGLVWNGSTFINITTVESSVAYSGEECFDVAYESQTGRAMIAWAKEGSNQPNYRIWTGNAWQSVASAPNLGSKARWVRLEPDPTSNRLVLATLNDNNNICATIWTGNSWSLTTTFAPNAVAKDRRCMDAVFEAGGERALVIYGRAGQQCLFYRVFDGTSWSAESIGPIIGNVPGVVQATGMSGQEIFLGFLEKDFSRLYFSRWTGSDFADTELIVSDVAGDHKIECFSFATNDRVRPKLMLWQEVQP